MLNLLSEITWQENVGKALTIMWQGVLAVFLVIGIIIGITYLLNKVTAPKKTDTKTEEDEELVENNNSDTDDYSSLLFNDLHLFLSPKEEQVIRCIFIFNMSTDEIAKTIGVSNWNVSNIQVLIA